MTRTEITRKICWLSFCVLLFQQTADMFLGQAPWIVWLAILLPLVVFIPGMLRDNLRSFIWVCFVSLMYFMRLVLRLFEDPADPLAIAGMVAVVLLFNSAMMYVRWRSQELNPPQTAEDGE